MSLLSIIGFFPTLIIWHSAPPSNKRHVTACYWNRLCCRSRIVWRCVMFLHVYLYMWVDTTDWIPLNWSVIILL